jgi:CBS-domain-containing membrane protein
MPTTCKPLAALTAADVMSRNVVAVPKYMPLRTAAWLLAHAQVSGAPVVDGRGNCVGVLSATDFLRWAHEGNREQVRPREDVCCDWQVLEMNVLPVEAVSGYMTADPVTAAPTATVRELARHMLDAHIHRVVIVDEDGRPVGVVSSTDVLAAVARQEDDE